jgi:hypothetical protein
LGLQLRLKEFDMGNLSASLKGLLKAKTFWVAVALAAVTNVAPAVQAWVSAHPGGSATIVATAFGVVMRFLTTESLAAKGGAPSA